MYQCQNCNQYYDLSVENLDYIATECHKDGGSGIAITIVACPTCGMTRIIGAELDFIDEDGKDKIILNMFARVIKKEDDLFQMKQFVGIPKPFNFTNLLRGENFPEIQFIMDYAKEQQAKGVPDQKIFSETLSLTLSQATKYCTQIVIKANEQIAEGIRELTTAECWDNLGRIAEHALEMKVVVMERAELCKNNKNSTPIVEFAKLKHELCSTKHGIDSIKEIFDRKWLEANYPTLAAAAYKEEG